VLSSLDHPVPSSVNPESKIEVLPGRRTAAKALSTLLEQNHTFSFLRLGDGEIQCIQAVRGGDLPPRYRFSATKAASIEAPFEVSGIESRHIPRMVSAFENCTYLDYCDSIPAVRLALPTLALNRPPSALRNLGPQTSNIIFEWTWSELKSYLTRHRCLLAASEARLLEGLCADPRYRKIADTVLPFDHLPIFHQVRDNGQRYSENLEAIKEDLRSDILRHRIDTLFLSLASGAKILCYELADELGIRCIDFGSMPRALCYAGTTGYHSHRSFHNPFLFRIPIDVYMAALERAHSELTVAELVSKAQAQVLLELYDLQPFQFNNSENVMGADIVRTSDAIRRFRQAEVWYNRFLRSRTSGNVEVKQLHTDFVRWRRKKGIGIDGRIFLALVRCKSIARTAFGKLSRTRLPA